jgi:Calcineurin-like phosphoesterase
MIARKAIATAMILIGSVYAASAQTESNKEQTIGILLAAGDISTCPKRQLEPDKDWHRYANRTAEIIRAEIKKAKDKNPPISVHVLALGDLAYSKGTADQFKCFAKRWSGFDDVLLPVPGNHEYLSKEAKPYFDHFKNNRYVNQNGQNKGYFSLNFPRKDGPWRLIGLNDNFEILKHHGKDMKEELKWLESKLDISNQANAQNCVLAFWHRPTSSSGRHGHDYKTARNSPLTNARPMKTAFAMLRRHGASIVLAVSSPLFQYQ